MSAHHGAHRPRRGAPGPTTTRQRTQGLQPHLATGRASQTLVCPDLTRAEDQRLAPGTTNPGPRAQPPRSTLPRRDPCRGPATCAKDSRSRSPRPAAAHHPARRPPGRQQSPGTARGPGTPWSRSQVKMETPEPESRRSCRVRIGWRGNDTGSSMAEPVSRVPTKQLKEGRN